MNRHPLIYLVVSPLQNSESDAVLTESLRRIRPNWLIMKVTSQEECLRRLRQPSNRPRVVLYDDGPPLDHDWHARDFIARVNESASSSVPVIVYSTGTRYERAVEGKSAEETYPGAFHVLELPVDLDEIVRPIEAAVASQPLLTPKKEM